MLGNTRALITLRAFLLICVFLSRGLVAFAADTLNDPFVMYQWGWLRIHCDQAYETGWHGSGVIIAVLDTGVDTEHPDLKDNLVEGYNFVDKNNDVTDSDGHGTMVAGIIAAEAAIKYVYQQGCVLIAAAGNDNSSEPFYPAFLGTPKI